LRRRRTQQPPPRDYCGGGDRDRTWFSADDNKCAATCAAQPRAAISPPPYYNVEIPPWVIVERLSVEPTAAIAMLPEPAHWRLRDYSRVFGGDESPSDAADDVNLHRTPPPPPYLNFSSSAAGSSPRKYEGGKCMRGGIVLTSVTTTFSPLALSAPPRPFVRTLASSIAPARNRTHVGLSITAPRAS